MEKKIQHIAFADDDPDDHHIFSTAISELNENIKLSSFHDCKKMITFLDQGNDLPDVIFLDLNMPEYDGRECLLRLKKEAGLKDIPVVVYSTSKYPKDIEFAYKFGAFNYVVKPQSFEDLKNVLKDLFSKLVSVKKD